jgi:plasmid stabilization system protein ParE
MYRPPPEHDIVLTPEQIAQAPEPVRQWLHSIYGNADWLEHGFILQRYGAMTSGDGLAICTSLEIKNILHLLRDDILSCEILFELGCDYRNPATGERRGHIVGLRDFLHHTEARNLTEVERGLDTINAALQNLRHDPDATLHRPDGHGGFRAHELTQHVIYEMWLRMVRLTARHHKCAAPEPDDLFSRAASLGRMSTLP